MSIEAARTSFENCFKEGDFYNRQTRDEKHLEKILDTINVSDGMKILDLGCGSGYLTFAIAGRNGNVHVTGLDIVAETLKKNKSEANERGIKNLTFTAYDGLHFPFEDGFYDMVVTRYALHHFPEIKKSINEVSRVLKKGGRFFLSDPRPNECDATRFVDDYMQLKKDGHIKFYTKDEWISICDECGMQLISSFDSQIRFPKKKSTAVGYEDVLSRHDGSMIESYDLAETAEELWITEQVNNLLFIKA